MLFGRWITTLACLTLLCLASRAEELDNQNLIKQIEGGISYKVLSNIITKSPNDCHFIDDSASRIAINQAAQKAKWEQKDIDELLTRVTELSKKNVQET